MALALAASACASVSSGSTLPSGGDDDDGAGPPQYGGRMVYGLEAETTNGWCLQEGQLAIAGIQVARSIYDTLTVPDGDGEFVPFLAESVTSNPTSPSGPSDCGRDHLPRRLAADRPCHFPLTG